MLKCLVLILVMHQMSPVLFNPTIFVKTRQDKWTFKSIVDPNKVQCVNVLSIFQENVYKIVFIELNSM